MDSEKANPVEWWRGVSNRQPTPKPRLIYVIHHYSSSFTHHWLAAVDPFIPIIIHSRLPCPVIDSIALGRPSQDFSGWVRFSFSLFSFILCLFCSVFLEYVCYFLVCISSSHLISSLLSLSLPSPHFLSCFEKAV